MKKERNISVVFAPVSQELSMLALIVQIECIVLNGHTFGCCIKKNKNSLTALFFLSDQVNVCYTKRTNHVI